MSLRRMIRCAKRSGMIAIAGIVLTLGTPALGQDRMVLGPRQFEYDKGGAVLCIWAILLSVQAETAACGLARRPIDDAIDDAIVAVDQFILANSSLHPTWAMLEDFKRRAAEEHLSQMRQLGPYCDRSDLEKLRSGTPDQLQSQIEALLAVPREPVMNPCL